MRLLSANRLVDASRAHPDAASALARWAVVVSAAKWKNLAEVRRTYPHADAVKVASGKSVTVFNVGGNKYRLLTAIDYPAEIVNVDALLTHAEYDKQKWKATR